ncbi:MAG TPA: hypothetical protein PLD62_10270, partial [Candidatus Cloacimonadota bacterium]|nr:hypothetical protein [Candidatus Cloacimonadota bacterium]
NILMMQDRIEANLQEQKAEPIRSNLFPMLESYGIKINTNLIADAECGQINLMTQRGIFRMNTPVSYPFLPLISNMNKDNMIVKNIDQMQLIFASEIDTSGNLAYEPLLYSSANSQLITFPKLDIGVEQYMNKNLKTMFIDGPFNIAGIFSGHFQTYFADRAAQEGGLTETTSARIILITDLEFIEDSGASGMKTNTEFVQNAIDYLASENTLIEIRSREIEYKPLKEISNGAKKLVRWLNILLPSLLLILIGILRYQKELQRRKFLGELYE